MALFDKITIYVWRSREVYTIPIVPKQQKHKIESIFTKVWKINLLDAFLLVKDLAGPADSPKYIDGINKETHKAIPKREMDKILN